MDEKAAMAVKALKPGDKTTLICRDTEKGEHQAVTGIKPPEEVLTSHRGREEDVSLPAAACCSA